MIRAKDALEACGHFPANGDGLADVACRIVGLRHVAPSGQGVRLIVAEVLRRDRGSPCGQVQGLERRAG